MFRLSYLIQSVFHTDHTSCSPGEEEEEDLPEGLDDKVVQVYRGVGKLLSRYTVGKIPKAFKIIPNLKNWEEILYLTDPEGWTPQAMFEVGGDPRERGRERLTCDLHSSV